MEKTYKTSEDIRKNGINMKSDPLLDEGMGSDNLFVSSGVNPGMKFYDQFKNPEINFYNQFKNPEINFYGQLEKQGIHISEEQRKQMNYRLSEMLDYEPTIGIFGKTGAGKSSLCNALFGKDVCKISDVEACTRRKQEVSLHMDNNEIRLWDVPGVGENEDRDKEYYQLYEEILTKMDLVLWLVKADDRALASDEAFYKRVLRKYVEEGKSFFIVLNQVDKVEPFREWDEEGHKPGLKQLQNIQRKINDVAKTFNVATSKVIPVSANEKYNLPVLVDEFIRALPQRKKLSVYTAVQKDCQSVKAGNEIKDVIFDCLKDVARSVLVGIAADFFDTAKCAALTGIDMYKYNRQTSKRKSPFCSKKNNSFFNR